MSDEPQDPRFERTLRATLADLEPGHVPATLRASVAGVPVRAARRGPTLRQLIALGGVAAVVLLAVVTATGMLRAVPGPNVGVQPSPSASDVPMGIHLELVPDDALAEMADIVAALETRLTAAGYEDATVTVAEGRIFVDVSADPADAERIAGLVTAVGRVEALQTGLDDIQPGTPIDGAAYTVLFSGDDVASADLLEVLAKPAGVILHLDADATDRLAEYSGSHVGEMFTIAVDGVAVVVPMIQDAITGGDLQVTLADGDDSALSLLAFLRSGPLPTELRLASEPASSVPSVAPSPPAPATPSPTPETFPSIVPVDADALRYVCSRFPFAASVLEQRRFDEQADTPEAEALRAHLAMEGPDYDWAPDEGWTLVGADDTGAEYVTTRDDGGVAFVRLTSEGGWRVDGWGDCQPRLVKGEGIETAQWALAPGQDIGPETTTFDALVTERACSGGQPADGRIVGPDVFSVGDALLVVFGVRPLDGAQTCPGNPSTRVTVTLPEPLGDRRLLDGSTAPPRAPIPNP